MTLPDPPPGQGPIDPRGAFSPPPPPPGNAGWAPPPPMRPPAPYPPMMPQWGPPPPRRRGFFKGLVIVVLLLALAISFMANLALVGDRISGGGTQTVLVQGNTNEKIAVIPVEGMIMEEQYQKFNKHMDAIEKDNDVKAVVIEIDTPGGSVTASDEIYKRITKFKAERNIPVIATQGGLATSGGYYVSCAADYVYSQPTTLTGNIGVIMPRFNVSKLMDKYGVEETTIASTGATFKNAGSMFKPEKPEETAYIQSICDQAFAQFKSIVVAGRAGKLAGKIDNIANGKVYTAKEAKSLGLVDAIGYADDAYAYAASKAGLTKMHVVRYSDPAGLLDLLRSQSNLGHPSATVNGVNINIDKDAITAILTPRLMYLWRGE
jgi:protease IV